MKEQKQTIAALIILWFLGLSLTSLGTPLEKHLALLKGYEWQYDPNVYHSNTEEDAQVLMTIIDSAHLPPVKRLRAIMVLRAFPHPKVAQYLLEKLKISNNHVVNINILSTLMASFTKNYSHRIVEVVNIKLYNGNITFIKEALISLNQINTLEAQTIKARFLEDNPQHARLLK